MSIEKTRVDDDAIAHLLKMPNLRHLRANGTLITKQGLDKLRPKVDA